MSPADPAQTCSIFISIGYFALNSENRFILNQSNRTFVINYPTYLINHYKRFNQDNCQPSHNTHVLILPIRDGIFSLK